MRIRVYTEQAWLSYPQMVCHGCFGNHLEPVRITSDHLIEVLERAAEPGADLEEYIVVSPTIIV